MMRLGERSKRAELYIHKRCMDVKSRRFSARKQWKVVEMAFEGIPRLSRFLFTDRR